jgi:Family of unknown function (DUF5677)
MDPEKSIILAEIRERYNRIIIEHNGAETPDVVQIENDIMEDADVIPPPVTAEIRKRAPRMLGVRTRTLHVVRRRIAETWEPALTELDQCLALADLVFARLAGAIFTNGDVLRQKDPRPAPDRVTGAYVKCLLLLSLYGKSCGIATEITSLLREGFPDAALSRLRTLHEHLVIISILGNDHDYEISERYEDCSVIELLKQLRTDLSALSDPIWDVPEEYEEKLQKEIAEVEDLAREIVARRGAAIRKPYEWARQALPQPERDNQRHKITFADLERAVGMDFFRGNYLTGNERIHAGSYSAVNYLNFDKPQVPQSRPRRDDWAIRLAGWRTAYLIGCVARAVGKSIAWETEEYDELLYVCELYRAADHVLDTFVSSAAGSSQSSL